MLLGDAPPRKDPGGIVNDRSMTMYEPFANRMPRALWRCEPCNAYHVGGEDIHDDGDDIVANCGARWVDGERNDELYEVGTAYIPAKDAEECDTGSEHAVAQPTPPQPQWAEVQRRG